jgi:hypothetical protein
MADDPDAIWTDRRPGFVQALADRLVALATDGSRSATALVDRFVSDIVGKALVPLVEHLPVPGETAADKFARLMGDVNLDDDDALPEPANSGHDALGSGPAPPDLQEAVTGFATPDPSPN